MKKAIYLFQYFVLFLLAVGCKDKTLIDPPIKEFMNTLWTLESFEVEGEVIMPPKDQIYTILFKDDSTFTGKADCNDIFGKYLISSDQSIKVIKIGTTFAYCGKNSMYTNYYSALDNIYSYRIDTTQLYLYYAKSSRLIFIHE